MKLKLLLLCFSLFFFTSCDDKGDVYTNPKAELTAEQFDLLKEGDTATYYIDDNTMYVSTEQGVYKTVIVSESDLVRSNSVGIELACLVVILILGIMIGLALFR